MGWHTRKWNRRGRVREGCRGERKRRRWRSGRAGRNGGWRNQRRMDHPLLSAWSQPPSQADKLLHPHHRYSGTKSSLVPDARVSPCPLLSKRFTSADDGSLDGRSSSRFTKTPNNLLFCSEPLTPRRQPKIVSRIIISDDFSLVPYEIDHPLRCFILE